MASTKYPRDLAGYGANPPDPQWPGDARIAVQLVLNYEEGAENCVLHGDPASESFLSEMAGNDARPGVRHLSMESLYEYGTRVGVWRQRRLFGAHRATGPAASGPAPGYATTRVSRRSMPNSERPCRAGDVVVYAPDEVHGMRAIEETLLLLATITPRPGTR